MDLRLISEIGVNDTLLVLEPARVCVGHCTFCYAQLNRRSRTTFHESGPDTLRALVNKAFGPAYDPTNFLQWGLRNKLPITWSSGVEPFQDTAAAHATWDLIERLDLPMFAQTRGTNWREVFPRMRERSDQTCLYVSLPSPDPAYVKRFEPGTPPVGERLALIDAAVGAGIPTMVALAPFRPEWCPDPGAHVASLAARGVKAFLLDPLHLNRRQRETCGDGETVRLAGLGWDGALVSAATEAFEATMDADASWWATDRAAMRYDLGSVAPFDWIKYRDATHFRYHDERFLERVDGTAETTGRPLLLEWAECLAVMEEDGASAIDQPFRFTEFRTAFFSTAGLAPAWQARLKPAAPVREHLRAIWNTPSRRGFVWGCPFVRAAVGDDGAPLVSSTGDLVLAYDPFAGPGTITQRVDRSDGRWDTFRHTPEGS